MYTPGTLLRLAREERNITLSEATYFVKIRENALHAMETDQFDKFPAAYMQTFLPEYADFLGVPNAKLAEAFKATLPEYGYLARSLYSRTLQHIAEKQILAQYRALHPTFAQRVRQGIRTHAQFAMVAAVAVFLLWYVFVSDASLVGTLIANSIVATPEEMRGTPFTELDNSVAVDAQRSSTTNAGMKDATSLQKTSLQKNSLQKNSLQKNNAYNAEPGPNEASMQVVDIGTLLSAAGESAMRLFGHQVQRTEAQAQLPPPESESSLLSSPSSSPSSSLTSDRAESIALKERKPDGAMVHSAVQDAATKEESQATIPKTLVPQMEESVVVQLPSREFMSALHRAEERMDARRERLEAGLGDIPAHDDTEKMDKIVSTLSSASSAKMFSENTVHSNSSGTEVFPETMRPQTLRMNASQKHTPRGTARNRALASMRSITHVEPILASAGQSNVTMSEFMASLYLQMRPPVVFAQISYSVSVIE
jgi:cytoskeletal protein RodZ